MSPRDLEAEGHSVTVAHTWVDNTLQVGVWRDSSRNDTFHRLHAGGCCPGGDEDKRIPRERAFRARAMSLRSTAGGQRALKDGSGLGSFISTGFI